MSKKITEDGEVIDEVTHQIVAMAPPFFKTPFNHDRDAESLATGLTCKDPSKTKQSFLAESDINNILAKFMRTGELPVQTTPAVYGEQEIIDLQDRMVTAWDVDQAWEKLPKEARAILQTPAKFVEWYDHCLETGNLEGFRDIGLLPKEAPKPPEEAHRPPTPPGGSPAPEADKGSLSPQKPA